MSEGEGEGVKYLLITAEGEERDMSRDYNGKGTANYPNGEIYEGDFAEGIRHGRGIYRYLNGDKYFGEWKDNKRHGIGKMTYKDGSEY